MSIKKLKEDPQVQKLIDTEVRRAVAAERKRVLAEVKNLTLTIKNGGDEE